MSKIHQTHFTVSKEMPWKNLVDAVICGNCGKKIIKGSEYTCKKCGRILCGECGEYCDNHSWLEKCWEL